jgi:N-acetylglutamate synthase-like GNAT family acetyltransferase
VGHAAREAATLRHAADADWSAILRVAAEAAPGKDNEAWLANRKAFADTGLVRRHYVAAAPRGGIIGYGAIEGDEQAARFRVFVVAAPHRLESAGRLLLERLTRDTDELGARGMWMRETADDPVLAFAEASGFRETRRFTVDQEQVVVLERTLPGRQR